MHDSGREKENGARPPEPIAVPVVDSEKLLAPSGELAISHEGEVYRLRRTRKGGLILSK